MELCAPLSPLTASEQQVVDALDRLRVAVDDQRRGRRTGFAYRLRMKPLDPDTLGAPIQYVVGRDLCRSGAGFEHSQPLPYRKIELTAADPRLDELGLGGLRFEVLLRWCRFVRPGHYESGGRIGKTNARLRRPA